LIKQPYLFIFNHQSDIIMGNVNNLHNRLLPPDYQCKERREFIKKSLILGGAAGLAGLGLTPGCSRESGEGISPAEDLMREHGVLNRILMIYDACRSHLINHESFPVDALESSALIIRNFIEEYHEKLEENFLFPRFIKAGILVDLVGVLKAQHSVGREITGQIIDLAKLPLVTGPDDSPKLIKLLADFNSMYRPHEAREDTVLFPSIRKVVKGKEYFDLGENFEDKEHELFGESGFESIVEKVSALEKQLGIDDLSKFTPQVQAAG
jgi:hemerythrin-like domain-containing protein